MSMQIEKLFPVALFDNFQTFIHIFKRSTIHVMNITYLCMLCKNEKTRTNPTHINSLIRQSKYKNECHNFGNQEASYNFFFKRCAEITQMIS